MDRSSVSRLPKQLENLSYVKREDSPKDRRAILLTLTEVKFHLHKTINFVSITDERSLISR
ncbi:hypothetical protein ACDZ28_18505 [Paenibacillus sp. RS8]|uniref:hypothetical protein n=1 Tax=Paenibacillus sp. RS8 TaxID=3242681 RepID=UPI0035BEDDA2